MSPPALNTSGILRLRIFIYYTIRRTPPSVRREPLEKKNSHHKMSTKNSTKRSVEVSPSVVYTLSGKWDAKYIRFYKNVYALPSNMINLLQLSLVIALS